MRTQTDCCTGDSDKACIGCFSNSAPAGKIALLLQQKQQQHAAVPVPQQQYLSSSNSNSSNSSSSSTTEESCRLALMTCSSSSSSSSRCRKPSLAAVSQAVAAEVRALLCDAANGSQQNVLHQFCRSGRFQDVAVACASGALRTLLTHADSCVRAVATACNAHACALVVALVYKSAHVTAIAAAAHSVSASVYD
eukprot:20105-Heterococcus_DN1.PRE.4